jgi:hypothetical protein
VIPLNRKKGSPGQILPDELEAGDDAVFVFFGESLPVKVVGPGEAGLAEADATAVLVDGEAAEGFDAGRNPDSIFDGEAESAGFLGGA